MARGASIAGRVRWVVLLTVVTLTSGLGGCASGTVGGLFGAGDGGATSGAPAPVTFAPIIGAPTNVSQRLSGQLATAARQRNIPVVEGETAAYTVRGYLAASPEPGNQSKIAYIWDVTDRQGQRVHRISGEEMVSGGGDPWAGVGEAAIEKIASRTASDLAAWLPRQTAPAAAQPAAARTEEARPAAPPEIQAFVPDVSGAPGDGEASLTRAIKQQLFKGGIKLANTRGEGVHTVRGTVNMGQPSDGQQTISIEWQVLDPAGQRLGTVSQKNNVQAGSLDGPWGGVADAAAAAAADGILKLLPRPQS